jgi:GNAT superfamily N-acetyltransferase
MQDLAFQTLRTNFRTPDFRLLVEKLDAELRDRDGTEHGFYDQFNGIEGLERAVVVYAGGFPAGCGALKWFTANSFEIKRMFVLPEFRGKGIARLVLSELETWALESGAVSCVLETGKRQPEAIALYRKSGFRQIENYGPYHGVENSLCFEKRLSTPLKEF